MTQNIEIWKQFILQKKIILFHKTFQTVGSLEESESGYE